MPQVNPNKTVIENLYDLFLSEMDYYLDSSGFMHKDPKNISDSGELVEIAFRKLLREVIGERFHITHGYIMGSNNSISPQVDLIITDTFVPHRFKKFEYLNGLELVPVESVVGIFEIKRTLNKDTIKKAQNHLNKIAQDISLKSNDKDGVPIIGVIALDHENEIISDYLEDVIFSANGYLAAPITETKKGLDFLPIPYRRKNHSDKYGYIEAGITFSRSQVLLRLIGYLTSYLNLVKGRPYNTNNYFRITPKRSDKNTASIE